MYNWLIISTLLVLRQWLLFRLCQFNDKTSIECDEQVRNNQNCKSFHPLPSRYIVLLSIFIHSSSIQCTKNIEKFELK